MMHVGGLMSFTPPPDAQKGFLRQLVDDSKANEVVDPWNLKLSHPDLLLQPDPVLGLRRQLRTGLPRAAFGAGQSGR